MTPLPEPQWTAWKRKRKNTLIGFIVIGIFGGIDCSIIVSTLYLYLKQMVQTDKPTLWYGVVTAVYFISSSVFGVISGWWLDRTRRVRLYANASLLLQVVGFLLYIIPYDPLYLLVGRIICGMGDPFTNVVAGEVFRIFDEKESTRAMFYLASIYSFGFIIGPSLNIIFVNIKINLGFVMINHLNFPGIFMSVLLLFVLLIANFLIHDCSIEFDLKEYLKNSQNAEVYEDESVDSTDEGKGLLKKDSGVHEEIIISNKNPRDTIVLSLTHSFELSDKQNQTEAKLEKELFSEKKTSYNSFNKDINETNNDQVVCIVDQSQPPLGVVLKHLFSNNETLLIFTSNFIYVYSLLTSSALIPLIVIDRLHWSLKILSAIYIINGIFDLLSLMLLSRYCTSNRSIYFASVGTLTTQTLNLGILVYFSLMGREPIADIIMIVLFLIFVTLGWSFETFARVLLAKFVPSQIQCFSETLRSGSSKFAMIAGSLTVGVMTPWLHWWAFAMVLVHVLLLIVYLVRKNTLLVPNEIELNNKLCP